MGDSRASKNELYQKMGKKKYVSTPVPNYSAKKAAAGKDIGKKGKNFAKIVKSASKTYGSKKAGERVAGAILKKLRQKAA